MNKLIFTIAFNSIFTLVLFSQNIGVGNPTPDASAKLDITSTNSGLLIPRVALTAANTAGPITAPATSLMVYNTATAGTPPNDVTPGYYYWNGVFWSRLLTESGNGWKVGTSTATTNALAATSGFLGTSTNSHVDLVTNNILRGRLTNLGEFFIGTTGTVLTGDLMGAVGSASFPWATNGYSAFDGAAVYGQITAGTTIFAGVQGEYNGTNAIGAGVRGIHLNTTAGTSFTAVAKGVEGTATTAGAYKFGTYGSGGTTPRSGAVLGNDYGLALGALGYYSFSGFDYGVYGFGQEYTTGLGSGLQDPDAGSDSRTALNRGTHHNLRYNGNATELAENTCIGLGIYGGVMGGWVRGLKYGFHAKGETYSMYIDGSGYTNKPFAYLVPTESGERVASYMTTSLQPEVTAKGKSHLEDGTVYVAFSSDFKKLISDPEDLIITATPQGNSLGVYVDRVTNDGFWINENQNGTTDVGISWIAVTTVKGQEENIVPEELLNRDFDVKMDGVMFNDNNTEDAPQPMWWDGTQMRWDAPPVRKVASVPASARGARNE